MESNKPEVIHMSHEEDCKGMSTEKVLKHAEYKHRRTSVFITLDHTDLTPVEIQQLMESGMSAVRFKMSHSELGEKLKLLKRVHKAAAACCIKYDVVEWPIATCIELRSHMTTTGLLEKDVKSIKLKENTEVLLTSKPEFYNKCNEKFIYIDNEYLERDMPIGTLISIEGIEIRLEYIELTEDKFMKCIVTQEGFLKNSCYVCARSVTYKQPLVTEKDLEVIRFAVEYNVDVITVNYTRRADTIKQIKKYLKELNVKQLPLIFGGIATEECLSDIDDIIKVSDGIIMARDFLPWECDVTRSMRLRHIRQWLSAKCLLTGKPFFVSGGNLNRTLRTGDYYLNEIFDVAHSVIDGVTGFVLRGCNDTELVLQAMNVLNDVCRNVEPLSNTMNMFWSVVNEIKMPLNAAEACALAAVTMANQSNAHVIIVASVNGDSIKMLMTLRPASILLVVSRKHAVTRMLRAYKGTVPIFYTDFPRGMNYQEAMDHRINYAVEYAVKRGWLAYGEMYVTLQRGSEVSSYCDTVMAFMCVLSTKQLMICPDETTYTKKNIEK